MGTAVTARVSSDEVVARLARRVGRERFERYLSGSAVIECRDGGVRVAVRSPFHKAWLDRRFGGDVRQAYREAAGAEASSVRWEVSPDSFGGEGSAGAAGGSAPEAVAPSAPGVAGGPGTRGAGGEARGTRGAGGGSGDGAGGARAGGGGSSACGGITPPIPPAAACPAPSRGRANAGPRYRSGDFVVGSCNRLGWSAVEQVASDRASFRVLFVHGACGVGKTHLLHAATELASRGVPGTRRVKYVTAEKFANEYITAVQQRSVDSFRKRYRGLDLLCIDDVHFIAGKKGTQNEFLHTFEALDLGGARVVLASDEHPRLINDLRGSIVSRCLSGMVVKLETPDRVTRMEIAGRLAARRGLVLEQGAMEVLVESAPASVRELEGAVVRLDAFVRLTLGESSAGVIDAGLVRRALGATGAGSSAGPARPVRVGEILRAVCEELGVEASEVLGSSRHKRVVLARSLAAYLARQLTTLSFPEIARELARPNHSTVITACRRVATQIETGRTERLDGSLAEVSVADLFDRLRVRVSSRAA